MATALSGLETAVIDSIEINNRNIYDLKDSRYSGFLFRNANHLHVVTRAQIVRQELLFKVGDTLVLELVDETARNLRTRFPFNDAWIEIEEISPGRLLVHVVTVDQWSLVGGLRAIDRDGDETNFQIGFEERNLIGRAQFLSFDYYARELEPNYISMSYREPRVFGRRWSIALDYRSDPQNNLKRLRTSKPYYSLAQNYRFDFAVSKASVRQERFDANGALGASWTTTGDNAEVGIGYRTGPSHRKITFRGEYKYLFRKVRDTVTYASDLPSGTPFAVDSIYHRFSIGATYALQSFIIEKRINGFDYNEDITLGLLARASVGRAFRPDFQSHHYDLITGSTVWSQKLGSSIIAAEYALAHWFKRQDQIRTQTALTFVLYNNRLSWMTFALRSRYRSDNADGNLNLVLGGKSGLRGYPREFAAGDRTHVLNLESRVFLPLELLSVKVGSAVFVDLGQAWNGGDHMALNQYNFSGGIGLRLSLEKLRRGEIIRIDAVLIEGGGWEISFGSGQYF